ncbi:unnamed protein product [Pleuronectes platessa]|uniref:Uncharacterized protein n=1 Tax=Pleuronectes platessa TaxID=8262 RepID=A0A9N7YXS8_PLEPL|nr:unnamed protein product [Pleuronectes platessa]
METSSASLAFQGELIASELRLFSHGPLVHLILTRWRASDDGTVKCAARDCVVDWQRDYQRSSVAEMKVAMIKTAEHNNTTCSRQDGAAYGAAVLPVGTRVVERAGGMRPEDLTTQKTKLMQTGIGLIGNCKLTEVAKVLEQQYEVVGGTEDGDLQYLELCSLVLRTRLQTATVPLLCGAGAAHMYSVYSAKDSGEYSPRQRMPSPLEVKRAVTAAPGERGRRGRHCWLHAEHFTHSPDVTGQGAGITSHQAPHNGSNCVIARQFTGPLDSSNTLYGGEVAAPLSTQRGRRDQGHKCGKTLEVNDA